MVFISVYNAIKSAFWSSWTMYVHLLESNHILRDLILEDINLSDCLPQILHLLRDCKLKGKNTMTHVCKRIFKAAVTLCHHSPTGMTPWSITIEGKILRHLKCQKEVTLSPVISNSSFIRMFEFTDKLFMWLQFVLIINYHNLLYQLCW